MADPVRELRRERAESGDRLLQGRHDRPRAGPDDDGEIRRPVPQSSRAIAHGRDVRVLAKLGRHRRLRRDEQLPLGLRRHRLQGWRHGQGDRGLRDGSVLVGIPGARRDVAHASGAIPVHDRQRAAGRRELVDLPGPEWGVGLRGRHDLVELGARQLQWPRVRRRANSANDREHPERVPKCRDPAAAAGAADHRRPGDERRLDLGNDRLADEQHREQPRRLRDDDRVRELRDERHAGEHPLGRVIRSRSEDDLPLPGHERRRLRPERHER